MSGLVVESRQTRRIIGRLAAGESLLAALAEVCQQRTVRAATIGLAGVLDAVALVHYDKASQATGKPRWFRSPLQILGGWGTLSEREGKPDLELRLVLSRQGDNGIEVLGGIVDSATVLSCEYVIDAMDDVLLRRRVDRRTGLPGWFELIGGDAAAGDDPASPPSSPSAATGASAAPARPSPPQDDEPDEPEDRDTQPGEPAPMWPGTGPSAAERWAAAAAASAAADKQEAPPAPAVAPVEDDEEEVDDYRPMKAGDFIEHASFGRCVVERVDANEEFATVRLRNKRLVRLSIDVLDLCYWHDEDGHQVFGPRNQR